MDYAFHMQGIHSMAHWTNLIVQVLFKLNMFCRLENLFQTLYAYFSKSSKRHLKLNKLAKIMEIQGSKLLKNVKTRWIFMWEPTKKLMSALWWSRWPWILLVAILP
jgi:hypothetical protein